MSGRQSEILEVYMNNDDMRKEVQEIHKSLDFMGEQIGKAAEIFWRIGNSNGEVDHDGEYGANIVDGIFEVARALHRIASALHNENDPMGEAYEAYGLKEDTMTE